MTLWPPENKSVLVKPKSGVLREGWLLRKLRTNLDL